MSLFLYPLVGGINNSFKKREFRVEAAMRNNMLDLCVITGT